MKIIPGQVWQNGSMAVKVQDEDNFLRLVIFNLMESKLRFQETGLYNEKDAEKIIKSLHCKLTDKILTLAD